MEAARSVLPTQTPQETNSASSHASASTGTRGVSRDGGRGGGWLPTAGSSERPGPCTAGFEEEEEDPPTTARQDAPSLLESTVLITGTERGEASTRQESRVIKVLIAHIGVKSKCHLRAVVAHHHGCT